MSCNLTTTTTNCIPCIHPFDYIFEKIGLGLLHPSNNMSFQEVLDRLLDKGIVEPNCGVCCPDCDGVYVLASVETFLKFAEAVYNPFGGCTFQGGCCSNVFASVETYLKYEEAVSGDNPTCCNGFTECTEELVCWVVQDDKNPVQAKDRLLDKGLVEFGNIPNNCTGVGGSSLCKFVELLAEYYTIDVDAQRSSKSEIIDRLLDKGIAIYCNPDTGDISIASVETMLIYLEAIGLTCSGPALPSPTSVTETTTVAEVVETTTTIIPVESTETTTTTTVVEGV